MPSPLALLRSVGAGLSEFTRRWVPDSWVICMMLTVVALLLAVFGAGSSVHSAVLAWGDGLWKLLTLAMQFTIIMVASYACVASRPVYRAMDRLAALPDPERPVQAVLLAGLLSMVTGYLNWALSLIAGAMFVPFLLKHNRRADVRVIIAAAYLGLGTVWHGGLSGSAPLIMATPGNPLLDPSTGTAVVERLYPITETLFNLFNVGYLLIIGAVALGVTCALHPARGAVTLTDEQLERILPKPPVDDAPSGLPGRRIERQRLWTWLAIALLAYPLAHSIATRGFGASWTINAYNVAFLVLALALHGRPDRFLNACRDGIGNTWGIVIQFPFYGGIFGLLQYTGLGAWLGEIFATVASRETYPFVVYVYSGLMNLFVPSAGSKWIIEAPFLLPAGNTLDVSATTVLLAYAYGDSTTNLIQPFFAIPLLAVTRMRFGDVVGYTFLVACACFLVSAVAMFIIPADFG